MVDSSSGRTKIARPAITTTVIASRVSRRLVLHGDGSETGYHGEPRLVEGGSWSLWRREMWSGGGRADVLPFFGFFRQKKVTFGQERVKWKFQL